VFLGLLTLVVSENRSGTRGAAHAVAVGERRAGFGRGMTHHLGRSYRLLGSRRRVHGSTGACGGVHAREWAKCAPLLREILLGEKK